MDEDRITIWGNFDAPAAMKSAQTMPTPVKNRRGYELELYLRKFYYFAEYTPLFRCCVSAYTFCAATIGGTVYSAVISSSLAWLKEARRKSGGLASLTRCENSLGAPIVATALLWNFD